MDGNELISFMLWPFYSLERAAGRHWLECQMGPWAGLDILENRKLLTLSTNLTLIPRSPSP